MKIDLNCDLGERFGRYELGEDEAVMPSITSANIACGLHAGDPLVIEQTLRLAKRFGVQVGAHPGYPDLQGFGRRVLDLSAEEAEAFTLYQVAALAGMAKANGLELVHVKPHGALYNQAAKDPQLAEAIARAVWRFSQSLILVGLAGSLLVQAGQALGMRVVNEAFPDRAYNPDGSLMSRKLPGTVLSATDAICANAVRLASQGITLASGKKIEVQTLCLHGDHPGAAQNACAVRHALEAQGVDVLPLK